MTKRVSILFYLIFLLLSGRQLPAQQLTRVPSYPLGTWWEMSMVSVDEAGDSTFRDEHVRIQVMSDTVVKRQKCWIMKGWEVAEGREDRSDEEISFLVSQKNLDLLGLKGRFSQDEWELMTFHMLDFPLKAGHVWNFKSERLAGAFDDEKRKKTMNVLCKVTQTVPFNGVRRHELQCEQQAFKIEYLYNEEDGRPSRSQAWFLAPEPEASFPGSCPPIIFIQADQSVGERQHFIIIEAFGVEAPAP